MTDARRHIQRISFYARGLVRYLTPQATHASRLEQVFTGIVPDKLDPTIRKRVNYYNRMRPEASLDGAVPRSGIHRGGSRYYIDFMEYFMGFGPDIRINYLPGDITQVPESPTIVKSRPIAGHPVNSVILNLDKFRHFRWVRDDIGFLAKLDNVVWRGIPNNVQRRALVDRVNDHPEFDVGFTGKNTGSYAPKRYLSIREQCRNRFIISVEGNDVATNLKWIMSSNSLCLSPKPKFETWFMEGTLIPGTHYVELQPDFADLEEKIAYYRHHTDEALDIIANANAYVRQFQNQPAEYLISQLVLQKYFERTGQRPAETFSHDLFD